MPKKFSTENSKALAARDRKKAAKDAEVIKKKQQEEDEYWKDDDKLIKKKQQRKVEQEKKKEEQQAKKAEAKLLLEQEIDSLKGGNSKKSTSKVTRAQIDSITKKENDQKPSKKIVTHLDLPLEENLNRLDVDGEEARTVTEAIEILNTKSEDIDKHPERRLKAAYLAYEERRLLELKETSSLRLSQLKQMIFKEWQKSSENPLNKRCD